MTKRIPLGWIRRHGRDELLRVDVSLLLRHHLVTGRSRAGKSMAAIGWLTSIMQNTDTKVVIVDPKSELASNVLRWAPIVLQSLSPANTAVLCPARDVLLPLNLVQIAGYSTDEIAAFVLDMIEAQIGEKMGNRMRPLTRDLIAFVRLIPGGSLRNCLELVEADPATLDMIRPPAAAVEAWPLLRARLEREGASTRAAIASRLREILHGPLGAMFSSKTCTDFGKIIKMSRLVSIDLGNSPLGSRGAMMGLSTLIIRLLAQALLDRKVGPNSPSLILVLDEAQSTIRQSSLVEILLQEVGYRKTSVWALTQGIEQIRAPGVRDALMVNSAVICAFSPRPTEISHLRGALPRPTGRALDQTGTRLLSETEERTLIERHVGSLPRRVAIFHDADRGEEAFIMRSATLPVEELDRRAAMLPVEKRRAFELGAFGISRSDLERNIISILPNPSSARKGMPRGSTGSRPLRVELPE